MKRSGCDVRVSRVAAPAARVALGTVAVLCMASTGLCELVGGETVDVADFVYDSGSGALSIIVHQDQVEAGIVIGMTEDVLAAYVPTLENFPKFLGALDAWEYQAFQGKAQYYDAFLLNGGTPITGGQNFVMGLAPAGLSLDEFGVVEYGSSQGSLFTEVTPEPATMGLVALGLAGLAARRRKRK